MRNQVAAANWKMNLNFRQGEQLLDDILGAEIRMKAHQRTIFAVPYPYLTMARSAVSNEKNYHVAAQNCHHKVSGAYTGEISAEMIHSLLVNYCIVGHSERREYFGETGNVLAEKINRCLEFFITPIFCCGESLSIRERNSQNDFVARQLEESLFHLSPEKMNMVMIAYEPIWAIGTGRTATSDQAQEMHAHIRSIIASRYGSGISEQLTILYGGSVKANNAKELFSCPDVDGGLVGGASLVAAEFIEIIKALKAG